MKKIIYIAILGIILNNTSIISHQHLENNNNLKTSETNKINNRERKKLNTEEVTYLDTDAVYYFSNLTQNYPKNYLGTCSYVALSMFLSYYDTFWDDDIIPYQYEVTPSSSVSINNFTSSPGVRADKIPGISDEDAFSMSATDYYNRVMSMTDTYFQPYLFSIAEENDILSPQTNDCFGSLTTYGREVFLNIYLQDYRGYNESDYTLTVLNNDYDISHSEEIKNYTIEKVKQGIPVLMTLDWDGFLHACVAYDYDENTDEIYIHGGFVEESSHLYAERGYSTTYFMSATTIEFHSAHKHSNNYILVKNGNVTYHCGCELETHNHKIKYAQKNELFHTLSCYCGYTSESYHICNGTTRFQRCIYCNKLVDTYSTPIVIQGKNDDDELI